MLVKIKDLPLGDQELFSKWLATKYKTKTRLIKSAKQHDYDVWTSCNYPCSS